MIRYTLACESGHEFESWFPSSAAFDEQVARGLVVCPICDSTRVGKALMAPAIGRSKREQSAPSSSVTEPAVPMIAEPERRIRQMLRALREHVVRTADHVGPRFAEEARSIHYGEKPMRSIYGEASPAEARALVEEGIQVAPLPPAPDDRN